MRAFGMATGFTAAIIVFLASAGHVLWKPSHGIDLGLMLLVIRSRAELPQTEELLDPI